MKMTRQQLEEMLARGGATIAPTKRKSKYNATKTEIDGITFDSKAEAHYYVQLKQLKKSGAIKYFEMQVPFMLPGKVKYLLDFLICWKDGRIEYHDVKGFRTPVFILKKKMVEDIYKILITEV